MTSTLPTRPAFVPSRMGALFGAHGVGMPGGVTFDALGEMCGVNAGTLRKMARVITPGDALRYHVERHAGRIAPALGVPEDVVIEALEEDVRVSRTVPEPDALVEVLERLPLLDAAGRERVFLALAEL